MKILGSVEIAITLPGNQHQNQTFQTLDSNTYSNILLGRDFMQTYGLLRLDFARNKTEMGAFSTPHLSTTNKQVGLGKPLPSLLDLKKVLLVKGSAQNAWLESDTYYPKKQKKE